jgi:lactoylglutathione lyase
MIRKLKFVSIPVRDQDRALDFYVNMLGFTLVTDQSMGPGQRWVEIRPPKGDSGVALFTPPGHENRVGTFTGISMECDDVQKTYDELMAKGVEFEKPPKTESWGVSAIMRDSEGNLIVLSSLTPLRSPRYSPTSASTTIS